MAMAKVGKTSVKGFLACKKNMKVALLAVVIVVSVCDVWNQGSHLATSQRKKSVLSKLWNHPTLEPTHVGLFMVGNTIYSFFKF